MDKIQMGKSQIDDPEKFEAKIPKKRTRKKKEVDLILDPDLVPDKLKMNNAPFGAGRTPKALQLKKYEYVLKRLDDNTEHILDVLFKLLDSTDENMQLRVAEMLLKKIIPDRKIKEIVGADGGPVQVQQNVDIRQMVINVKDVLDDLDIGEVKEKTEDGNFKIINVNPRTGS